MAIKESDGKHFDPHTGNPEPIFVPQMVGIALITKMAFAISVILWKIATIGKCFGTRGKNGRTVSSPQFHFRSM